MNIEIANKLVQLRKQHNLSQEDLANKLGISRQAVSKWERAEASPDTDNLIKLASIYKISLDELLLSDEKLVEEIVQSRNEDEDKSEKIDEERKDNSNNNRLIIYPRRKIIAVISTVMTISFFVIGFSTNKWEVAWLTFLLVPLIDSLIFSIKTKKANYFNYPIFVTIIFFILGFCFNLWGYAWIVFITIPLYYSIINLIKS